MSVVRTAAANAPRLHVLSEYRESHDKNAVAHIMPDSQGHLVAGAHAVYDRLYTEGRIVEVACWFHARRYDFKFKALAADPQRARAPHCVTSARC